MYKYVIYKTTNTVNGKIYIGFHSVPKDEYVEPYCASGSIFHIPYFGSGKLIKRALKKYGELSFSQDLLYETPCKEDAEAKEREYVTPEFTLREDTYNIAIGGNVRVFHGENNPFYGKDHSLEFKEENSKRHTGNKYNSLKKNNKIMVVSTGEIFLDFAELKKAGYATSKRRLYRGVQEGIFVMLDPSRQEFIMNYKPKMDEERRKILNMAKRERFERVVRAPEAREKAKKSQREWIKNNPEKHMERMLKINKNPEKIRKMAEKHRGMKRSDEARKNISESLKGKPSHSKNRVMAHDPHANPPVNKYFNSVEEIPAGWVRGAVTKGKIRGRSYTNGIEYRIFSSPDVVPDGWVLGAPPKKKGGNHGDQAI